MTPAPSPTPEPPHDLRDDMAVVLHQQGCREDSDGSGCGGACVEDTDALLAGPLAFVPTLIAELRKRDAALLGLRQQLRDLTADRDDLSADLRAALAPVSHDADGGEKSESRSNPSNPYPLTRSPWSTR